MKHTYGDRGCTHVCAYNNTVRDVGHSPHKENATAHWSANKGGRSATTGSGMTNFAHARAPCNVARCYGDVAPSGGGVRGAPYRSEERSAVRIAR